ncbi:biotin--[acetyl-CoA-carboxylase] ligase [Parvibaculaceae bacterium PLY_AMNH_Bact1]|nr:biotin--[acetyl-CoA-carboxylase] ligase [Parvibaculaceae bacterium PLY_AMNH_Bact1]
MPDALAVPAGYKLNRHGEIDSTNEEAKRLAASGVSGPVWIVADTQTAGRGRRGRAWTSPIGNLMCTLLLRPGCGPAEAGELSFVAGLALHDAASQLLSDEVSSKVSLKWPNDLLIDGKKASGILLESESAGGLEVSWLAIGIGLNLVHFPNDTPYPATSLQAESGVVYSVGYALTALAAAFDKWYATWQQPGGFNAIREAWLKSARGVGQKITVRLADETLVGTFEGLSEDGALQLRLPSGARQQIAAGDVFFGAGGGSR